MYDTAHTDPTAGPRRAPQTNAQRGLQYGCVVSPSQERPSALQTKRYTVFSMQCRQSSSEPSVYAAPTNELEAFEMAHSRCLGRIGVDFSSMAEGQWVSSRAAAAETTP